MNKNKAQTDLFWKNRNFEPRYGQCMQFWGFSLDPSKGRYTSPMKIHAE